MPVFLLQRCPANTFSPGNSTSQCARCPTNTESPAGSTSLADCLPQPGFSLINGAAVPVSCPSSHPSQHRGADLEVSQQQAATHICSLGQWLCDGDSNTWLAEQADMSSSLLLKEPFARQALREAVAANPFFANISISPCGYSRLCTTVSVKGSPWMQVSKAALAVWLTCHMLCLDALC